MTDHHDDIEQDATMPPTDTAATAHHPRVRRLDRGADRTAGTRLDPYGLYDVAAPTVRVSPIGVHTRGAAATTPPHGTPVPPVPPAVATLNALLDDRDRIAADTRRAGKAWTGRPMFRVRRKPVRTVRDVAARRAEARLRHERHLEVLETVKAYIAVLTLVALFLLVVGMAAVSFAILSGFMTWQPSRV